MTSSNLRLLLFLVIALHGLIHLMGFTKAFKFAEVSQLMQAISRPAGLAWLLCTLLFAAAGALLIFRQTLVPASPSARCSPSTRLEN